jgi:hypothetical protein
MAGRIPLSFEVWTQARAKRAIRDTRGEALVTVYLPIASYALHRAAAPWRQYLSIDRQSDEGHVGTAQAGSKVSADPFWYERLLVHHQCQRAFDIVPVPRLQKATHKCVVVARQFGSS